MSREISHTAHCERCPQGHTDKGTYMALERLTLAESLVSEAHVRSTAPDQLRFDEV